VIRYKLGGRPVTIHETATLDVGQFYDWTRQTSNRLLGLDTEGWPFNHEDRMNHYGPLKDRWMRLIQFGSVDEAWNLDPLGIPSHREVVQAVLENPWHQYTTWGSFDPENVHQSLGIDITDRSYSGMTLANLLHPGPLEAHDLKTTGTMLGMPELQAVDQEQDARWSKISVPAPRKPVRPRIRKGESKDEYAERLFEFRKVTLVKWQLEVQRYYERYPLREAARPTPQGGYKSGWSGYRDIDRDDPLFQLYAGLDAITARVAWPQQVELLKERGVYRPLKDEVRLEQAMTRVKIQGTLIDIAHANARLDSVRPVHEDAKARFLELTGLKVASSKRVDWLDDRGMVWNPRAVTKTGAPGLGKNHVTDYLAKHAPDEPGGEPHGVSHEVYRALELIKQAAETQNLVSFVGGMVEMADPRGRVHPSTNVLGAKTGRWTVKEPAVQTFSRTNGTRGIVIPEPGHVLVSIDQSQIEVRVFAAASRCEPLIEAFNNGEDVYGTVAQRLYGHGWSKDDRAVCKRIILGGCLYCGGPGTIATQLHDLDGIVIREERVKEQRDKFYQQYPAGRRFIRRMTSDKDVWLPSGRYVPGDPDKEYRGTNSYCQGTARDLIVQTLLRCFDLGYERNVRMVVHDEIIFSLPIVGLEEALIKLAGAFRVPFMDVNLDCDVEVYPERWGGKMITFKGAGQWETGSSKKGTLRTDDRFEEALPFAA